MDVIQSGTAKKVAVGVAAAYGAIALRGEATGKSWLCIEKTLYNTRIGMNDFDNPLI